MYYLQKTKKKRQKKKTSHPPTTNFWEGSLISSGLPSLPSASESSASQETAGHSKCLHVQLFLLCPRGSPENAKKAINEKAEHDKLLRWDKI